MFKILDTGNFYLPIMQKGKKFEVLETITLIITDKEKMTKWKIMNEIYDKINLIPMKQLAEFFWDEIKKEKLDKKYKDCWIVPLRLDFKKEITITFDILK